MWPANWFGSEIKSLRTMHWVSLTAYNVMSTRTEFQFTCLSGNEETTNITKQTKVTRCNVSISKFLTSHKRSQFKFQHKLNKEHVKKNTILTWAKQYALAKAYSNIPLWLTNWQRKIKQNIESSQTIFWGSGLTRSRQFFRGHLTHFLPIPITNGAGCLFI